MHPRTTGLITALCWAPPSSVPFQVIQYLASCGLKSCPLLLAKGYPDIGWNPVEGERYLDFLRFAVFCNGNLVLLYASIDLLAPPVCIYKPISRPSQSRVWTITSPDSLVLIAVILCGRPRGSISLVCVVRFHHRSNRLVSTGESVEENAYMVLRLLIRRPECFGPALQGDGGNGLLAAMREAIRISDDPSMDGPSCRHQSNRTMSVNIWMTSTVGRFPP